MVTQNKQTLSAGLYIVPTPIGNLGDISARALDILKSADVVACEDSRVTGKLLKHFSISTPLKSYHEHNSQAQLPGIIKSIEDGAAVALVSDAGTPLVSDPGYRLVAACHEQGIRVTPVPGACAAITALSAAGLASDQFLFCGFLPAKPGARQKAIESLIDQSATLIFYETGPRLAATLEDCGRIMGNRPATVARELTKLYEEVVQDTLFELAERYKDDQPKGEIVLLIGGEKEEKETSITATTKALLSRALADLSVKSAASLISDLTGINRKQLYKAALDLSKDER